MRRLIPVLAAVVLCGAHASAEAQAVGLVLESGDEAIEGEALRAALREAIDADVQAIVDPAEATLFVFGKVDADGPAMIQIQTEGFVETFRVARTEDPDWLLHWLTEQIVRRISYTTTLLAWDGARLVLSGPELPVWPARGMRPPVLLSWGEGDPATAGGWAARRSRRPPVLLSWGEGDPVREPAEGLSRPPPAR